MLNAYAKAVENKNAVDDAYATTEVVEVYFKPVDDVDNEISSHDDVDEEESHTDVVTAPEFPVDDTEEDSEEEKTAKTRGNH